MFVQTLKNENVKFCVAPKEADREIVFLLRNNFDDFAISEDSDLIVHRCPMV